MKAIRGLQGGRSRGQSLVEFALVLPLLLLLLLVCIDFGRIFLGYINLQNMSRIGASYAASNPTAWQGSGDATVQARYQTQIASDALATNCTLPKVSGTPTAPAPTFSGTNLGDTATVSLSCSFQVITPIISNILGGTVTVSSSAAFPIKSAMVATGGGSVTPPTAIITATPTSGPPGMTVTFDGSLSQGSITSWSWDFNGDGVPDSTLPSPAMPITYSTVGNFAASLTVSNSAGSSTDTVNITVSNPLVVAFDTSTPRTGTAPLKVTFNDKTTGGATSWLWTFGDGGTSTEQNPTYTYNSPGTFDVSLRVNNLTTATQSKYIIVTAPLCTVPNFSNTSTNVAQATWAAAGFTTTVQFQQGDLPWIIQSQSIVGNSDVVCSAVITVSKN